MKAKVWFLQMDVYYLEVCTRYVDFYIYTRHGSWGVKFTLVLSLSDTVSSQQPSFCCVRIQKDSLDLILPYYGTFSHSLPHYLYFYTICCPRLKNIYSFWLYLHYNKVGAYCLSLNCYFYVASRPMLCWEVKNLKVNIEK